MGHGKLTRFKSLVTLTLKWLFWSTKAIIIHHVKWVCNSFPVFSLQLCRGESRATQRARYRRIPTWDDGREGETVPGCWGESVFYWSSHVLVPSQQSQDSGSESQLNTSSLKEVLDRFNHSRTPSASSRSSRKSSHTAVSDPTCKSTQQVSTNTIIQLNMFVPFVFSASQMKIQGDRSTPGRQSVSAVEMTSQRRSSISSQVSQQQSRRVSETQPTVLWSALCLCGSPISSRWALKTQARIWHRPWLPSSRSHNSRNSKCRPVAK